MKLIMVVATSNDEYIASDAFPHPDTWTSTEDKAHLSTLVKNHSLLVFGRNTYDVYGKNHSRGTLRIVLTRNPEKYAQDVVPGELEFLNMTPEVLVKAYEKRFDSCLVLGGAYIYESFLKSGLVNEIYHTIEPVAFGSGKGILASGKLLKETINLPKPSVIKLNEKGTILKHYVF